MLEKIEKTISNQISTKFWKNFLLIYEILETKKLHIIVTERKSNFFDFGSLTKQKFVHFLGENVLYVPYKHLDRYEREMEWNRLKQGYE